MRRKSFICSLGATLIAPMVFVGCATETSQAVAPQQVHTAKTAYNGAKSTLAVGKFDNRSSFMRGLFSDGVDRLGGQAKTILITHLQQANRFTVVDRDNMGEISQEAQFKGQVQKIKGADFVITGDISEFGRKEVGDQQFFGILGRGKSQIAYAKVTINVVDTATSEVVFSARGAGEYELSNREVVGFGGTAGYDATLNGKVLDLALLHLDLLLEALQRLVLLADLRRLHEPPSAAPRSSGYRVG